MWQANGNSIALEMPGKPVLLRRELNNETWSS